VVRPTLCRIDVVETKVDRLIHLGDTNLFRDFPRPKPDLGDLTPVVEQDGGEGHLMVVSFGFLSCGFLEREGENQNREVR